MADISAECAQFLLTVYELCVAAELGNLTVELESSTGERILGVPAVAGEPGEDWPHAGPPFVVEIAKRRVDLDRTVMCAVLAPGMTGSQGRR